MSRTDAYIRILLYRGMSGWLLSCHVFIHIQLPPFKHKKITHFPGSFIARLVQETFVKIVRYEMEKLACIAIKDCNDVSAFSVLNILSLISCRLLFSTVCEALSSFSPYVNFSVCGTYVPGAVTFAITLHMDTAEERQGVTSDS